MNSQSSHSIDDLFKGGLITLYHGTTFDFTVIDVKKGKPFKDFGQGFYATKNYESAVSINTFSGHSGQQVC